MNNLQVERDWLIVKKLFSSQKIHYKDIEKIVVSRVLSICNELGIFLYCPSQVLVDESDPLFFELAKNLDISSIFGPNWYSRVEAGEVLEWTRPHS